ncbi:hypothetical protein HY636_03390 [Candidatus Woesearchaeota archaeon]|nr:hypothetical protein [Candidatus Woesearchaeota archaeon]
MKAAALFSEMKKRLKIGERKKLEIEKGKKLEVAISLSDLISLSLDTQAYGQFFENLYEAIEIDSSFHDYVSDSSTISCSQGLMGILSLERDYFSIEADILQGTEHYHAYSLEKLKEEMSKRLNHAFEALSQSYKLLSHNDAKEFVNKNLGYIRSLRNTNNPAHQNDEVRAFVELAVNIPLPSSSPFLNNGSWTFLQEKVVGDFQSRIKALEEIVEKAGIKEKRISEIKAEFERRTAGYKHELLSRIKQPAIMRLLSNAPFNISSNLPVNTPVNIPSRSSQDLQSFQDLQSSQDSQLVAIAHSIITHGFLILPTPVQMSSYAEKDFNDLVEFQFPNDNQYLIEEVSNSRDAMAAQVEFRFYQNGLTIQDDGKSMSREFFFKSYPLPYITLKNGKVKIGRFGVGAKAKLAEVMKHHKEVIVETQDIRNTSGTRDTRNTKDARCARNTRDGLHSTNSCNDAFRQRYFMHNGLLYIAFSKSQLAQKGVRISVISDIYTKERAEAQRAILEKGVKYIPPKFKVVVDGKQVNKTNFWEENKNKTTVLSYNGESARVYFEPLIKERLSDGLVDKLVGRRAQTTKLVYLSGDNEICSIHAPFSGVIEIPLQFQPVEGRDDFVYTPELRRYLSDVFSKVILPNMEGAYLSNTVDVERCARWFLNTRSNQNPFYNFEQMGDKRDMIHFYKLLYFKKSLNHNSNIVSVSYASCDKLNELIPSDLFIVKRDNSQPHYVLTLDYYIRLTDSQRSEATKTTETTGINETIKTTRISETIKTTETTEIKRYCERIMASVFEAQRHDFKLMKGKLFVNEKQARLLYTTELNHDSPFYYDASQRLLIINACHPSFYQVSSKEDKLKREFYLIEMLRIAQND